MESWGLFGESKDDLDASVFISNKDWLLRLKRLREVLAAEVVISWILLWC